MSGSAASASSTSFAISPGAANRFSTDDLETVHTASDLILTRARAGAPKATPGYAGDVTPQEAWNLLIDHAAVLLDVRTAEERQFVGRVNNSVHVPWLIGPSLQRNPRFVREVEAKLRRDDVVLLLCRSGARSVAAAQALTEARFRNAFNILEGFEGEIDESQQRGNRSGWRFHHLPWTQD